MFWFLGFIAVYTVLTVVFGAICFYDSFFND